MYWVPTYAKEKNKAERGWEALGKRFFKVLDRMAKQGLGGKELFEFLFGGSKGMYRVALWERDTCTHLHTCTQACTSANTLRWECAWEGEERGQFDWS